MTHRSSPRSLIAAMAALALAGCGDGGGYSGTFKRSLAGEGDVEMKLGSGNVELMLPAPRWPADVDIKAPVRFVGDTLVFAADTAALACQTAEARYVLTQSEGGLAIRGVGMDSCGGRRAAMVGSWTKS